MTGTSSITKPEDLSEETIQTYHRRGFVHIPQVISKEEAEHYRGVALELSQRMRSLHTGPVFVQLVNAWQAEPEMRPLTLHPNVGAIAQRLAGIPLRLWHDHILIKQPHNNAATEFHQDFPYWPHATSRHTLSAWIALVDVPVERGCMTFIPGSHSVTNLKPQDLQDASSLFSMHPDLAWHERVTVPLKAGDCTFHHGLCAHMATPNLTDEPRVAHIVIFMDANTTYKQKKHIITDPLGLEEGQPLAGELFPAVDDVVKHG
jgi:ectoine hydroxylase-related dioxygenase (phytanoyl-CoA dioxygenase family)